MAREVKEEAGVGVTDVRYQSSQPWPFPASLMIGFHATATTTELRVNRDELEVARWFRRYELLAPTEASACRAPIRSPAAWSTTGSKAPHRARRRCNGARPWIHRRAAVCR